MHELIKQYPIISTQVDSRELSVILRECEKILSAGVDGAIVEFGCYVGTTALFLQRLIDRAKNKKELYLYDSFAGLPYKTAQDLSPSGEQFRAGELRASKDELVKNFRRANLLLPHIYKAWFHELTTHELPGRIAFAFLDGDFYESIRDSLELIWPRLAKGSVVIVDDYQSSALPGARKAVDEWLVTHAAALKAEASLAIIKPNL